MKKTGGYSRNTKRPLTSASDNKQQDYHDYLKRLARKRDELIRQGESNLAHALERLRLSSVSNADNIRCLLTRHASLFPSTSFSSTSRERQPTFTYEQMLDMAFPIQGKRIVLSKPTKETVLSGDVKDVNEVANENLRRFKVANWCCSKRPKCKKYLICSRECVAKPKVESKSENRINRFSVKGQPCGLGKTPEKPIDNSLKMSDFTNALSNSDLSKNSNALPSSDATNSNLEMRPLPYKLDCLLVGNSFSPNTNMANGEPTPETLKVEYVPLLQRKKMIMSQDDKSFKLDCFSVGDRLDEGKLNDLYNSYGSPTETDNESKVEENTLPKIREELLTKRPIFELPNLSLVALGKDCEKVLPCILKGQVENEPLNQEISEIPIRSVMSEKRGKQLLPRIPKEESINGIPKIQINNVPEMSVTSFKKNGELLPVKSKEDSINHMSKAPSNDVSEISVTSSEKREENLSPKKPKDQFRYDIHKSSTNEVPELSVSSLEKKESDVLPRIPKEILIHGIDKEPSTETPKHYMTSEEHTETMPHRIAEDQTLTALLEQSCEGRPKEQVINEIAKYNISEIRELNVTSPEENIDKTLPRIQNEQVTNYNVSRPDTEMSEIPGSSTEETVDEIENTLPRILKEQIREESWIQKEQVTNSNASRPVTEMSELLGWSTEENEKEVENTLPRIQKEQMLNDTANRPIIEKSEHSVTSADEKEETVASRIQKEQAIYERAEIPVIQISEMFMRSLDQNKKKTLPSLPQKQSIRSRHFLTSLEQDNANAPMIQKEQASNDTSKFPVIEITETCVTLEESRKNIIPGIQKEESIKESTSELPEIVETTTEESQDNALPKISEIDERSVSELSETSVSLVEETHHNLLPKIQNYRKKRPMSNKSERSMTSSEECEFNTLPMIRREQILNYLFTCPISETSETSSEESDNKSWIQTEQVINDTSDRFVTSSEDCDYNTLPRLQNEQAIGYSVEHSLSEIMDMIASSLEERENITSSRSRKESPIKDPVCEISEISMTSSEDVKDHEMNTFRLPDIRPISGNQMTNENIQDVNTEDEIDDR